jgi:O-antigen/teichoic acid export membrane protein
MAVMSVAGLVSGIWLAAKERVARPEASDPNIRNAAMDHWRYGRWAAATGIVGCLPGQLYFLMLPQLESSGALRAMTLLLMPAFQAISAICMILLPQLSRARGTPQYAKIMKLAMLVVVGGPLIYWAFLGAFHYPLMRLVYGGKFLDCSHLLWIIGLQPVLCAILGVYMAALGAQERPDMIFYTNLVGAVVTFTLGIWMTMRFGLWGVAWSANIASVLSVLVGWYCIRRVARATVGATAIAEIA